MNNEYLELKLQAKECLNQMSIIDGDAFINNILFELTETDDTNMEIKKQILNEIKKLLGIKNKFKIKSDDLYYLKSISEKLRKEISLEDEEIYKVLNIIKNNF